MLIPFNTDFSKYAGQNGRDPDILSVIHAVQCSRNHGFLHASFTLLHFSVYKASEVTPEDMYLALPNFSHSLSSNQCNDKIISEGLNS